MTKKEITKIANERVALLSKGKMTKKEKARFDFLTEQIIKAVPRVTKADFKYLDDISKSLAASTRRFNKIMKNIEGDIHVKQIPN